MTWATFDVWGDDEANGPEQVHVIPTYEDHDVSDCWCEPRGDEGVFVHRDALDRDPPARPVPAPPTDTPGNPDAPSVPDQSRPVPAPDNPYADLLLSDEGVEAAVSAATSVSRERYPQWKVDLFRTGISERQQSPSGHISGRAVRAPGA